MHGLLTVIPAVRLRCALVRCLPPSTRGSCSPRHTTTSHGLRTVMRNCGLKHQVGLRRGSAPAGTWVWVCGERGGWVESAEGLRLGWGEEELAGIQIKARLHKGPAAASTFMGTRWG